MKEKSYLKTVSSNFLQIDYKKLESDSCKFIVKALQNSIKFLEKGDKQ